MNDEVKAEIGIQNPEVRMKMSLYFILNEDEPMFYSDLRILNSISYLRVHRSAFIVPRSSFRVHPFFYDSSR
jgi:hypothetical protein